MSNLEIQVDKLEDEVAPGEFKREAMETDKRCEGEVAPGEFKRETMETDVGSPVVISPETQTHVVGGGSRSPEIQQAEDVVGGVSPGSLEVHMNIVYSFLNILH